MLNSNLTCHLALTQAGQVEAIARQMSDDVTTFSVQYHIAGKENAN